MSAAPTTFGKYFLTEKIATGGMAEIYLAKLLGPGGFEKHLIIKQIHPAFGNRPEFVELFVKEAKTLVSLSHGNIVPIYELGVLDNVYFIAMEYIDGPTLARLIDEAPGRDQIIEPGMAAYICAELLEGLDYAHRKGAGVIHRDLSARNVMLSRDGGVKIVDFGIAATVDDNLADDGADDTPVGSFPYMSPEQVRRETLDPRTDLFSAGILLWEALAGRRLFARESPQDTLAAVCEADIAAPSALNPTVPTALDQICLRALERDRTARYQSAGEFHARLNRFLYTVEPPVTAAALSQLVARACPPIVRRRRGSSAGYPPADDKSEPAPGGSTRRMPRERPGTTQTFATHLKFRDVLDKATPLMPISAIPDSVPGLDQLDPDPAPPGVPAEPAEVTAAPDHRPEARRYAPWLIAGLVATGIGGAVVATRSSDPAATRPPGPPDAAARAPAVDAAAPQIPDAAPGPTAPPDATPPQRPPDARPPTRKVDAAPRVRAKGRLKVLADPWGKVYLKGKLLGTAPGEWDVPAGTHRLRVVFTGIDGVEQTRSATIAVRANETATTKIIAFDVD